MSTRPVTTHGSFHTAAYGSNDQLLDAVVPHLTSAISENVSTASPGASGGARCSPDPRAVATSSPVDTTSQSRRMPS